MKEVGGQGATKALAEKIVDYWEKLGFSKIKAKAVLRDEFVPAHQKRTKDGELVEIPAGVIRLWVVKSNIGVHGFPPS